jgi:hypothetical protein
MAVPQVAPGCANKYAGSDSIAGIMNLAYFIGNGLVVEKYSDIN